MKREKEEETVYRREAEITLQDSADCDGTDGKDTEKETSFKSIEKFYFFKQRPSQTEFFFTERIRTVLFSIKIFIFKNINNSRIFYCAN